MLVIVPPSETKRPSPESGEPVRFEELSFPELTPLRRRVAEALISTSAGHDAFDRLHLPPTMAGEIARNARLLEIPAMPAGELYSGPLHEGLDLAGLTPSGRDRAARDVVIVSALWGLVRPDDRIPRYRLRAWDRLVDVDRPYAAWREALPAALARAAEGGDPFVELRAPPIRAMGMAPEDAGETILVGVTGERTGRRVAEVYVKRTRGAAAHRLLDAPTDPSSPEDVADILAASWPLRLEGPERRGGPWTLTLSVAD